jgi:GDP-fucose protein O-fucosyltransferase
METVVGLAIATGRTLVLPAEQRMYLLAKGRGQQKTDFGFADFFPMHDLARDNDGLDIITMQEFLETEAGNLRNKYTGLVEYPPDNGRTDWNGQDVKILKEWLRNVTLTPLWSPTQCMAAFPASTKGGDALATGSILTAALSNPIRDKFLDRPLPVDADPVERLRENLAGRRELCLYDEEMQAAPVVHFMCAHKLHVRMLVHFYAFLYFEDWREDLWMKRYVFGVRFDTTPALLNRFACFV